MTAKPAPPPADAAIAAARTTRQPSRVEPIGWLYCHDDDRLADEDPLFAAGREYAWRKGGVFTRTFLQSLPEVWQSGRIVVDSELCWLQPGVCPLTDVFHRETYPVAPDNVAYALANAELDVEHVAVCLGVSAMEFIEGEIDWSVMPKIARDTRGRWDRKGAVARDEHLRALIAAGELVLRRVEPGEVVCYDGRAFSRRLPAGRDGFSLFIRASRGTRRPMVNGIRTHMGTER